MKDHLIVGVDLGSSAIRLAVGQVSMGQDKREVLSIIGAVEVPSQGISKGAVNSLEDVVSSISASLEQIERQIGLPVSEVYLSIGGVHLTIQSAKGVIGVSRPEGEIREEDVHRALEAARSIVNPANQEIIHILPKTFSVDGQTGIKDPVGMQGIRLEAEAHIIQGFSSHVRNITKAAFRTGLEVRELVFAPLASAEAVTTSRQRDVGTVVINVGAGTTSVAVFEEGDLLHAAIFPIGADHITSDLAIGLRTSLELAEHIKRHFASAHAESANRFEEIDLRELGGDHAEIVSRRFVSDIAEARAEEIFEKVEKELKKIDRSGMLPAGAILTGGGVKLGGMTEIARQVLRLPVSIGTPVGIITPLTEIVQDPAFSTAVGLILWGYNAEREDAGVATKGGSSYAAKGGEAFKRLSEPLKRIFKSFLP
ncbi:cell division protein FtsA [Patescibacteria group bacterium]|nr:cell division protein FtsA [Patescibacteria group bacterium]